MWQIMFVICGILVNGEQGCGPIEENNPTYHATKEACEETLEYHAKGIVLQHMRVGITVTSIKGGCVIKGQDV